MRENTVEDTVVAGVGNVLDIRPSPAEVTDEVAVYCRWAPSSEPETTAAARWITTIGNV
jgi:hypothetical protein